jgi:integrase
MTIESQMKASLEGPATPTPINLGDVLIALKSYKALSETRRRDLRSSIKRVAQLIGDDPARMPLDLPAIGAKLANVNPVAVGLSRKTLANVRSDFLAAVKASGLKPVQRSAKTPLSAAWKKLIAGLSNQRTRIGISRLARYASALDIAPEQVDDVAVRDGSLIKRPNDVHRKMALVWNEVVRLSALNLQPVTVPSFPRALKRIKWVLLPNTFRNDVEAYLSWCGGHDAFAADARSRALGPQTLKLRRNQIHAAVTALVQSGIEPTAITALADLVSPENFKRILRRRHETVGGRGNTFNCNLVSVLVQVARQWVKVDAGVVAELTRLAGKIPMPMSGLTDKNKRFLRQFDDPAVLRRLFDFPPRLWAEVKRDTNSNFRTLANAQAALAVAILCYMPLRLQNLAALTFDVHLFVRESPHATSSLELSADEVKNRTELAFDIPSDIAKMLIEYRNRVAPKIIGHRPNRLFVNVDGTPKKQATVASMITTYLNRRAGIVLTSHQFRHLSAKVLLDAEPGSFEIVRQLLGHKSLKTTVGAYAGINSRRAARHHQRLVEEALAAEKPRHRPKELAS